ncbi:MAG: polyprenyl synthetase family protein [Phycisphaeraceae bacterium]|nr:polyprenyl synthetase family protein [Phycisphaeraceae bacterium]
MSDGSAATKTSGLDDLLACGRDIEPLMDRILTERPLPSNLREAARYSLLGPGKRLRPALVLLSAQAVGGRSEDARSAAVALEMIHCFSLIHDDLPAMDDDDLRRGRPTLHRHAGEAMAILAGDLLNTLPFELLAGDPILSRRGLAASAVRELAAATAEMIAGQVYDTLPRFPEDMEPLDRLRLIHRHKTGALIRAACRLGAICADPETDGHRRAAKLEALTGYGEAIGLMFQIVDDLLDVTASTEDLGKSAGKDQAQGKLTYPGILGIEETRRHIEQQATSAIGFLAPLGDAGESLARLVEVLADRRR